MWPWGLGLSRRTGAHGGGSAAEPPALLAPAAAESNCWRKQEGRGVQRSRRSAAGATGEGPGAQLLEQQEAVEGLSCWSRELGGDSDFRGSATAARIRSGGSAAVAGMGRPEGCVWTPGLGCRRLEGVPGFSCWSQDGVRGGAPGSAAGLRRCWTQPLEPGGFRPGSDSEPTTQQLTPAAEPRTPRPHPGLK